MTGQTMSRPGRLARLRPALFGVAINLALLSVMDWGLVKLDLLSPPFQYGLSDVGFGYPGVRRSSDFGAPRAPASAGGLTMAMVGDSHSQLLFDDPLDTHEFVLEARLRETGAPVTMVSAGRGRYSPLQEYLLFRSSLEPEYHPRVLVMNVYSGNDFYDMLRPDDRPHYVTDVTGAISTADPEWIAFVDPDRRSWIQRSRLLWGIDELSSRLGYPRVVTRLRMLSAAARRPGHSIGDTVGYLSDLRKSQEPRLGYPAAFAAQILNQALFFKHYPESMDDSITYMRHLLASARAENPDVMLVLASIPSAALMGAIPVGVEDEWRDTLERTGLTEAWVAALENDLVDRLETVSRSEGWLFVDLRACLRAHRVRSELYSSIDLHINAAASRLIGDCQASALLSQPAFTDLLREATGSPAREGPH